MRAMVLIDHIGLLLGYVLVGAYFLAPIVFLAVSLFLFLRQKNHGNHPPPLPDDRPERPSLLSGKNTPFTGNIETEGEGKDEDKNREHVTNWGRSLDSVFEAGFSVLLYGPTGSGKTFGIVLDHLKKLEASGRLDGVVLIPCTDGMEDYDLLSKPIPIGPEEKVRMLLDLSKQFPEVDFSAISRTLGDWTRVEGPLKAAFRRAASGERLAVVFDELNRASRSARNLVLKAIDPVLGHYELHDFTSGEILKAPIGSLQFCATCNLGASYSQTHDLDESLLDRFQSVLFVDYSTRLERRILASEGLAREQADRLVHVAVSLRDAYKMGHLAAPLSTRHLKNWGRAIARGADPISSARSLWVDRLIAHDRHGYPDTDQVQAILEILGLNFQSQASRRNSPDSLP
jgi:MoxR-like ATPase